MPSASTHAFVGALAGTVLFGEPEHILVALAGSLLPDADSRHALAGRMIPLWIFLKHRGWTHSLLFAALSVSLLAPCDGSLAAAFGVGYLTHLLLDALTPSGVPLFFPFSKHRFFRHSDGRHRRKRPPTRKKLWPR